MILPGDPPVVVTLRRSARARRLSLRVSRLSGQVTLTCPPYVPDAEAHRFAAEKEPWMRKHLASRPEQTLIEIGATLPIEGRMTPVFAGPGRRARFTEDGLAVCADKPVGPQVVGLLKTLARDRLVAASDRYSAQIGRRYDRIALRDTRSRWGSCSSQGTLSYSWRLIMAPPDVLNYVAAHEVCHLDQMNHSRAFWSLVEQIYPGFEVPRRWLRAEGEALHSYRFVAED